MIYDVWVRFNSIVRFEVPLPDETSRKAMVTHWLGCELLKLYGDHNDLV